MSSTSSAASTAQTPSASPATEQESQLLYSFDDRHWRVRGLEKQLSCERLKVNLLVSRRDLVHIDTLDLCTEKKWGHVPIRRLIEQDR
jgi:hypothetical protein